MSFDFDYVVIGSGFGGSVMSLRLVEKGYKVLMLERGKEYPMQSFPRRSSELRKKLFWDPEEKTYGYMEFLNNPDSDIATLTASGLGGGSLIYANVLYRMPEDYFKGWPFNINRAVLEPHYDRVIDMMEASPYPLDTNEYYKDTPKAHELRQVGNKMPKTDDMLTKPEFFQPHLAVRFQGTFPGEQSLNKHGAVQSNCTKCGECDVGCNIKAKNTLDVNYIFKARNGNFKHKLEVRTESQVEHIIPINGGTDGYKIHYIHPIDKTETIITAAHVVVSAGSVGSSSLLLKQKKSGNLKNLSARLGMQWCGNGDLLGFVANCKSVVEPTKGPVITGAIAHRYQPYPDGFPHGFYVEDAGYPTWMSLMMNAKIPHPTSLFESIKIGASMIWRWFAKAVGIHCDSGEVNLGAEFKQVIEKDEFLKHAYVLLGMGRDRSTGHIVLRESDNQPITKWDIEPSQLHFDRLRTQFKEFANIMGGEYVDNPLTWLNKIIAVHPLGGCTMGESAETGVVNEKGQAYGYKGLYIVDGSILPTSAGVNPALTIAAMAEHIAEQIPAKNS